PPVRRLEPDPPGPPLHHGRARRLRRLAAGTWCAGLKHDPDPATSLARGWAAQPQDPEQGRGARLCARRAEYGHLPCESRSCRYTCLNYVQITRDAAIAPLGTAR